MKLLNNRNVVVIGIITIAIFASMSAVTAQDAPDGPEVSVDHSETVAPGEEFDITVEGTDAIELALTELPADWTLTDVSTDPTETLALTPSPGELPNESTSGDTWLAIFNEEQASASYTLTVEAPDAEGTYEFTASAEDVEGEVTTDTFEIEVNTEETTIGTEHKELIEPGEETEITVDGVNTEELTLTELAEGWTLTDISAEPESDTTLTPSSDNLPIESNNETFTEWNAEFDTDESSVSVTFTLVAPEEEDDYSFEAEGTATAAAGGETLTESVDIEVRSGPETVTHDEAVAPNDSTDITVGGEDVEELRLSDVPADWVLTDTTASQIQGTLFFPGASELPQKSEGDETWLAIFDGPQTTGTFSMTVRAPNKTGEYEFTAEALNGDEQIQEFNINVTEAASEPDEPDEHESGVTQPLFDAVDSSGDGELARNDIREMINKYATDGNINDVPLERDDVRNLINYYATQ